MTPTERLRAIHELAARLLATDDDEAAVDLYLSARRGIREIVRLSEGAAEADGWKPVMVDDIIRCDEGTSYLFAVGTADGWEYFSNAIICDGETEAYFRDDNGWEFFDNCYYRELPAPPKVE